MRDFGIVDMDRNSVRRIICSPTIDIHPADGTVHPTSDDAPCGRLARHASSSVALPRTMRSHRLFPLSFPSVQPASALAGGHEHIDPGPDFGGGATMKMLMGPEVIVDRPCVHQRPVERGGIVNHMWHQQPFQGSDQALDPAVLPRAARLAVLQANAQEVQCEAESPRRKHRFVVGAQHARATILTTRDDEMVPDRPRRLVRQALDTQAGPAGMIDNRQRQMRATGRIGLGQQVHPPDEIARHRTRHAMLQFSAQVQDGVLLASHRVGDVGFADGHLPTDREAPVEGVHDCAAARMGHEGFEPNDLVSHPTRFGRRMRSSRGTADSWARPKDPRWRAYPSTQPVPQPGAPSNEPPQLMQQHSPPTISWITEWMAT